MEQTCEWIRRASGGSVSVEHLQRPNAGPPLGGGLMEPTYGDASRLPLPGHVLRHATLTDNRVPTGWLPVRRGSVSGSPRARHRPRSIPLPREAVALGVG